jgi:hypothetical protein
VESEPLAALRGEARVSRVSRGVSRVSRVSRVSGVRRRIVFVTISCQSRVNFVIVPESGRFSLRTLFHVRGSYFL